MDPVFAPTDLAWTPGLLRAQTEMHRVQHGIAVLRERQDGLKDYKLSHKHFQRRVQQWQRSGLLTRPLQKLAEDLRDRGKLDWSESFSDASFSSAKKGALLSALLAAAKAAKSWRSATAMVFLSPYTWPALRLMKQNSWNPPSSGASSPKLPNG